MLSQEPINQVNITFSWEELGEENGQESSVNWKNDAQYESCKLDFIGGKMRTAAQEKVPPVVSRNCFKA